MNPFAVIFDLQRLYDRIKADPNDQAARDALADYERAGILIEREYGPGELEDAPDPDALGLEQLKSWDDFERFLDEVASWPKRPEPEGPKSVGPLAKAIVEGMARRLTGDGVDAARLADEVLREHSATVLEYRDRLVHYALKRADRRAEVMPENGDECFRYALEGIIDDVREDLVKYCLERSVDEMCECALEGETDKFGASS